MIDSQPDNDCGFLLTRTDSETIGVGFSQRLAGRCSAAEVVVDGEKILDRGDLITKEAADKIKGGVIPADYAA